MNIVFDILTIEECSRGDIVFIENNNQIDDKFYVILNENEYSSLEEFGLYLFENNCQPKTYKAKKKMKFYKIAEVEEKWLEEYDEKRGV